MPRADDFDKRREHLSGLSDEQLKQKFWELAEKVTDPLVLMARKHTSPSIERSVLMRMGFSSIDAKEIVRRCVEYGLLGKGAGHCVVKLAELNACDYLQAGKNLASGEGWRALQLAWSKGVSQS